MTPFLRQVASVYINRESDALLNYCFVFPNKRSGAFFRHYLSLEANGRTFIMPEIATIADVTRHFSALTEAPRLDQLFILYNEYRTLSGDDTADFDQFLFWGDMLLNDFNDVDLYLVDPHKLFVNLKRFREVSSNYLTDEQIEIINRYWGEKFVNINPDEFWNHLHDSPTPLEAKFLKLWEVLDTLFERFKKRLLDNGMATRGMFARNAVNRLSKATKVQLPFTRYIFVGFNVLTLAEIKIFEKLQTKGLADFYWDMASPAFKAPGNRAALFMKRNVECFPSLYDISLSYPESLHFPKIHITGVPSAFGQTKVAGLQLDEWVTDKTISVPSDAIDTAIVLPDEALFIPMIHAVPPSIDAINVTMGFPLKNTAISSLMSTIVNMHLHSSVSRGEWSFFYEDIRSVVTHPFLQAILPDECEKLLKIMLEKRLYMVKAQLIAETIPALAFIFTPILNTNEIDEVHTYFFKLLSSLRIFTSGNNERLIENYFLDTYLVELENIRSACDRWNIAMKNTTFIQLLQSTIASANIRFTGEPLKGLQIMGALETRALDFENLIMLSMNERVFPRKQYSRSFIPDNLRRSYGMATTELQESIFAYSFYRLISRASNVRLFYDARTLSGKNSEISRYIAQLLYLFPSCEIEHDLASFSSVQSDEDVIVINKDTEIMEKMREYTVPDGKALSASSINEYINCPLAFYLKYICGLNLDEEIMDYMDSGTYGNILHDAAERLYKELRGKNDEVKITSDILDSFINDHVRIDSVITELINEKYNRYPKGDRTPLIGECKVLAHVMKHFLIMMFREEKKIAPFDFIDGEHRVESTMRISSSLNINIKQFIDRIDRVYPTGRYGDGLGCLRIVDYKTGGDLTDFKDMDDLFDPEQKDRRKAILQLLFYCNAYADKIGYDGPIKPQIYPFRTLSTRGLSPITYASEPLDDYRKVNNEFLERFRATITEMFNPDIPFTQAAKEDSCTFCNFKIICRKHIGKN